MLIEFRVQNFRSLRDEQVLSMVASSDDSLAETNLVATGVSAAPRLVRSAAILGPNAGGKSNLVKALQWMRFLVLSSAKDVQPGQVLRVSPFRLDAQCMQAPMRFEITFIVEGVRYQYGLAVAAERVVHEQLLVYKHFKPQRWFERNYDATTARDVYAYGPSFRGPKHVWEAATRANALFLSTAAQLNSEGLRPVYDWFAHHLVVVNELERLTFDASLALALESDGRSAIIDLLGDADISIADIEIERRAVPHHDVRIDAATGAVASQARMVDAHVVRFHHRTEAGSAAFDFADESSGTRSLFAFAGPLVDVFSRGRTLVVDELDASLHPLIVRQLVRRFHVGHPSSPAAQLLFTTHDTSLLSAPGLFRRDQIWFVEKGADQSSTLYPLTDFHPRKHEAIERGYLAGRYGAVPFLNETAELVH
jgi:hypothetical protein